MPRRAPLSPLETLGLSGPEERLYARTLPLTGVAAPGVAAALGVDAHALEDTLLPLTRLGLAALVDGKLQVLSLSDAIGVLIRREAEAVSRTEQRLARLAVAVPLMVAAATRPGTGEVDDVRPIEGEVTCGETRLSEVRICMTREGEVTSGGNPLTLLTNLIADSRGDLLWLRPDAWRMPRESAMVGVITAAIASGRRSRAIYPVMALQEAPEVLRARAQAGEEVRVLSELPTRLMVIEGGVRPDGHERPALVEALIMLFEQLWERAATVPELDRGEARPDLRRFLLQLLAAGQKDEQIARTLGLSLRTVRRRVADLMTELGTDSRFQAGVEATRRGWI